MRLVLTLLLFCSFASHASVSQGEGEHNRLTPEQIADGWISLFDGETLFGWESTSKADWRVEEGVIRVGAGEKGFLMTASQFADYELHVEFKAPESTNSGVFVRSAKLPTNTKVDCIEVNIAPRDNAFPTASLVSRLKIDLQHGGKVRKESGTQNIAKLDAWDGNWHSFDIQVKGRHCIVRLDGVEPSVFFSEERNYGALIGKVMPRGHIGLQHNSGEIAFRNVRLKPLGTKPIFNGKDLTGWNTDRADESRFEVTDAGELQVLNGRGQLESDASYDDFLLQLECFVNGDALNSGIFFRCIPRDFMMGYECQIQNGMKDNDPTKPQDCGTGGFFRRQNARRIVAKDHQWFALTLIADGPHMAAWVDGRQVSDWTDTRKPNENPRRGLRIEPGTLAIQGHDPTTDLRFRKLKIAELPAAKE